MTRLSLLLLLALAGCGDALPCAGFVPKTQIIAVPGGFQADGGIAMACATLCTENQCMATTTDAGAPAVACTQVCDN